ncbi:MAG: hypothetical protein JXP72_07505 [Coriobacteriia bacterium]|nr:hypothetical protein [Coriobacteriia bacterium]
MEPVGDSYWGELARKHGCRRLIAVATLFVVIVAGVLAWSLSARGPELGVPESSGTVPPPASADETMSNEATASVEPTQGVEPGGGSRADTPEPSGEPQPTRAPKVAYRRDGWVCVASEDGTGEQRLFESAEGRFSLSPDGGTLAVVDLESLYLTLVDVETEQATRVNQATQDTPAWSPDSAWLVYTEPGPRVRRVKRDGTDDVGLFAGKLPAVSIDGSRIVGVMPEGERVAIWEDTRMQRFSVDAPITGIAADADTVYVGTGPAETTPSLRAFATDGRVVATLVSAPDAERAVSFSDLMLCPNGATLAYAEHGDDGYSRLFTVATSGGAAVQRSLRRDCYPLSWSADCGAVLFIEGNALQGERTALARVTLADGIMSVLVEGAGL